MSQLDSLLLEKFLPNKTTRLQAESLLRMARPRTAPGTGMSVDEGGIGLPAICALIACERLGDRSFSKEVAQRASCLRPQLFEQTLTTVRTVLKEQDNLAPSRSTRSAQRPISYDSLTKKYGANRVDPNIVKDCQRVERGLGVALDDTSGWNDRRITATIFWWCCEARGIPIVPEKEYIKTHEISQNDWNLIKFQLTRCMQDEYQRLRAKASGTTKQPPPRPANVIKIRRRGVATDANTSGTTPKRKGSPSYENEDDDDTYGTNPQSHDVSSPGPPLTPPFAHSLPPASPLTKRAGPLKYRPVYPDRNMYGMERIALRTQAAADFMAWRAGNLVVDIPSK
ncbi:ORC6 domain protein [Rhizoctonia solani AG-3 Rhs1AP]|uniref:ORC6 domain protein n=1 Tax=Rhizoctonia solani AG-3 Rhs1AP TaxID=1086054 RepID=X8JGB1_9AGAM|nr:ORC6 domain protein [Rhizoctonia solani AG-3 Rhs1AP]